jgi:hypothetical protein
MASEQKIEFILKQNFPTLLYNTSGEVWSPLMVDENALTKEQIKQIISILTPSQINCLFLYAKEEEKERD